MGFDWRGLATALLLVALLLAGAAGAATVQYVYDDLGRLVTVIDGNGVATVYSYDAAGNLVSVTRGGDQLSVTAFVPDRGKAGDAVTIYGTRFVADPAQNGVSFNGTPAAVSAATAGMLVVTVPAGASTGPISVTNANGSATSAATFFVIAPPVITGVSPDTVAQGFSTRVQIQGAFLRHTTAVTFSQPGITTLLAGGATDSALPVEVRVAASVAPGQYGFTVSNAAGSTASGSVVLNVGVGSTGTFMAVGRPVSVFQPHPPNAPPAAGDSQAVSPATSVFMPASAQSPPPSGDGMGVSPATSVSMP